MPILQTESKTSPDGAPGATNATTTTMSFKIPAKTEYGKHEDGPVFPFLTNKAGSPAQIIKVTYTFTQDGVYLPPSTTFIPPKKDSSTMDQVD